MLVNCIAAVLISQHRLNAAWLKSVKQADRLTTKVNQEASGWRSKVKGVPRELLLAWGRLGQALVISGKMRTPLRHLKLSQRRRLIFHWLFLSDVFLGSCTLLPGLWMILFLPSFHHYGWKQHENDSSQMSTNIPAVVLRYTVVWCDRCNKKDYCDFKANSINGTVCPHAIY